MSGPADLLLFSHLLSRTEDRLEVEHLALLLYDDPALVEAVAERVGGLMEAFYRTIAYGAPLESDLFLAADAISTIYSAYLSAARCGTAVDVRTFSQ